MNITLAHVRRMGHIKRWHLVNTTRQQTLAEHSFMVAIIVARMMQKLGFDMTAAMWRQAMFHDVAEIAIGDIPTPAKKLISGPAVTRAEQRIGRAIQDEFPWAGAVEPSFANESFMAVLDCADVMEAFLWIRENGAGEQAKRASDQLALALTERVERWAGDVPGIAALVDEILEEWHSESTLLL